MKWLADMRQPTLEHYAALTREHWDSDLIIWPETAIPLFSYQATGFLDRMTAEAALNATELLVGLVYQDPDTGAYYNSMVGLGVDGGRYDKRHLVPFTEYLPLKSVLAGVVDFLDVPMSDFSAGSNDQPPMSLAGQSLGITICFEDAFGEDVIRALPQATLLVNVSNDAWFAGTIAPAQHLQMARMRALESGREMLRATNTGISAFIAADGHLRQVAPQYSSAVLTLDVQPRAGATPYVLVGNAAAVVIVAAMLAFAVLRRRPAGRLAETPD
jgi:apolipoprotein N-acyltransferase